MRFLLASIILTIGLQAEANPDLLRQLYGQGSHAATVVASKAASVELRLSEESLIRRERVYLQDLASCIGDDFACKELNVVEVGISPPPGRQEKWSLERISSLIGSEFPQHSIVWSGAPRVQINAHSASVQEEVVRKALEKNLDSLQGSVRFRIQSLRGPSSKILRHDDYSYSFPNFQEEIEKLVSNPRRRFVQIRALAHDTHLDSPESYEIPLQVTFFSEIQAVTAKSNFSRAERIDENDVELRWVPFQEQVLTSPRDAIGKVVRSRIVAQQPIRSWDLASEPDVQRGEKIQAVIIGNGVKMSGIGHALENGSLGQKIRVRLESTKRNVTGTVIARSQVEVPMP